VELVEEGTECFQWYDHNSAESVSNAISDLLAYIAVEGPFDGVMGFSQGASLAAMILALPEFPGPFAFGVCICSGLPFSVDVLGDGIVRACDPSIDTDMINVPTAHIVGAQDASKEYGMVVFGICSKDLRVLYEHSAGHEIPTKPRAVVDEMVNTIRKVIAMTSFAT
jgi:hypothetical protein